ncbi:hypothetical protein [Thiolapillus sp.]|uniref:hypothetical protein n=1 Tax=Thiolapillus sp. TaxID=2017437 RepID=UPI0025F3822B|nr:hypothetical protein [Thiolapillus sp.]
MRTTGKQCGLAATGVYQPSLRSPWLAAVALFTQLILSHQQQQTAFRPWSGAISVSVTINP